MICKPNTNTRRKGDSLWEVGVFLGKTENNLCLAGMHGEVCASRSAKRLADDYRGEFVESAKTFPWQIKQSVLTTKDIPRRVLPGPAPVPALPGISAPGGAIEDAGPGSDEQAQIRQVQKNKEVKGMQQELVQVRLLQQNCVHPWKMLQLNLKMQLCQ